MDRSAEVTAFLTTDPASHERLRAYAISFAEAVAQAQGSQPFSGADPSGLAAAIAALDPCPDEGVGIEQLLTELRRDVLDHAVHLSHPRSLAHFQCPTLLLASAAELAIGATNQSLDSFDQAPAATYVEDQLVSWLAATLGLAGGSGVLTSGGTASNLLGLMLARERAAASAHAARAHARGDSRSDGLPACFTRWRIVASAAAHDSVRRSAAVLGLGTDRVVGVATDSAGRMDVVALDATLDALERERIEVIAIVATAGTTDLGAIDPLAQIAERARRQDAWLHVDAAVGSALALSPRLAPLLDGIELADSITADLHKLWFMPIGASALLVRDGALLQAVHHSSDYLNRVEDEDDGVLNLVGRSLDTSRRFDALKVLAGLRGTGRRRMAMMIEHLVELAQASAGLICAHGDFELLAPPSTVTVVFRWRPAHNPPADAVLDDVNVAAQRALLRSGRAIVGRTRVSERVALKLTFVNPLAGADDVRAVLDLVAAAAEQALQRAGQAVQLTAIRSTTNTSVSSGPITPPAPRLP